MAESVFEIYVDKAKDYRFRLKAPNGEIIARGEGYTTKQNCEHCIERIKEYAPAARLVDLTK